MVKVARGWYRRYADWYSVNSAALFTFVAVGLLLCGVVSAQATVENGRQNRAADRADAQRDRDRDNLLDCIDDRDAFAAKSSQNLRDVTQVRDTLSQKRGWATLRKETALVEWTNILLTAPLDGSGQAELVASFVQATAELQNAAAHLKDVERDLIAANKDLKQARKDNPVTPPASEVCATGKFVPPEPKP